MVEKGKFFDDCLSNGAKVRAVIERHLVQVGLKHHCGYIRALCGSVIERHLVQVGLKHHELLEVLVWLASNRETFGTSRVETGIFPLLRLTLFCNRETFGTSRIETYL